MSWTIPLSRLLIGSSALLVWSAMAETLPAHPDPTPLAAGCTLSARATANGEDLLHGQWLVQFWAPEQAESTPSIRKGRLTLSAHPEYPGSVFGRFEYADAASPSQALVSGDLLAGSLNLDESWDGVNVDAVWQGETDAVDCAHRHPVLRGVRMPVNGRTPVAPAWRFRLEKLAEPAW